MIYFSSFIIPFILSIIIFIGLKENKNVFELFCKGAEDGIKIAIKLFPTLIAIFLAIGILRESGMLDKVSSMLEILLKRFNVPQDVVTKEVHWYLMMADNYYSKPQKEEYFVDSGYYKFHEAYHLLKFPNEKQILEKAYAEYLERKRNNQWMN